MLCACIDIGSNTTRVLVAEVRDGHLTEVVHERAFVALGADLLDHGAVAPATVTTVATVVAEHRALAERLGSAALHVVATAAVRSAGNRDELLAAVRARAGIEVEVLDGEREARLAFLGATRTMRLEPGAVVGVVDVGGGSTEIAVGTLAGGTTWTASVHVGSTLLAHAHQRSDPPDAAELEAMRGHAAAAIESLAIPAVELGVAVGGSAASLRTVVGPVLDDRRLRAGLHELCREPAAELARRLQLDRRRVRLLPAGIIVLESASRRLGCALQLGCGGVREGICLELASASGPLSSH